MCKLYVVLCKQTDYNQYTPERIFKDYNRAKAHAEHSKFSLRFYEKFIILEVDSDDDLLKDSNEVVV